MAMEISRNFHDYSVRRQNYSSYTAQSTAGNTAADSIKKKETENASGITEGNGTKSAAEYMRGLEKLAPSVEFKIGSSFSTAKSGKTLTIHPKLLEKMQNDPEQEKETKELIRGVESAMNMVESMCKASGRTIVYKHSYIDENGKYHSIAQYRNDLMLNISAKLREERKEISEQMLEKSKEKAAAKRAESEERAEKKVSLLNPAKANLIGGVKPDRMAGEYAAGMEKLVKENHPGWKPGDAFDIPILDRLDGTLGGIDFKA